MAVTKGFKQQQNWPLATSHVHFHQM